MTTLSATVTILLLGSSLGFTTQSQTIPERVAENPDKPLSIVSTTDLRLIPMSDLAAKADLIVVGRLVKREGYLSADGREVYTDYEVIPRRVIVDRASTAARGRPGQLSPLTVTVYGGETVVNGVTVTLSDATGPKWAEGADLLMFLLRNTDKPNNFRLFGRSAGAFAVDPAGRLKSLTHGQKHEEIEGAQLEEVVNRIMATKPH